MKKLFISQPMRGKTEAEITKERVEAIAKARELVNDEISVLDTYFSNYDGHPLKFLAKSIDKLAEADIVFFAKGWKDARGCMIEHACAVEYGIPIILYYND